MEITVNDYDVSDDGFMVVKDMTFCALCILGNGVEPCFESANIQFSITPENEEFKKNFSAMLSELKELASQDLKKVFEIETEEGGEMKLDKEMLTYDGEETTEETTTGEETTGTEGETTGTGTESEGETTSTESGTTGTEGGTTGTEGGSGSEGASGSGDTSGSSGTSDETPAATVGADDVPTTRKKRPDEFVLEYSKTYNELRDALCTAVRGMCEIETLGDTVVSETDYYLCDFDDEYVYAEYCTYSAEGRKGGYIRARYAKVEDNIEISTPEEMFVKWLTGEEVLALEKSREELTALREFKAERLAGDHKNEVDKYIAENFCDINATEEFIALGEEIYSLDSEQLTEKLFAIRGRHASFNPIKPDSKASDKNEAIKIPVDTNKKSSKNEGRYGSLFETYAKK
ncbi:MAG: hypothetical protein J6T96_05190 [Bacteroidales bacterium]|nr:hypothetical protein [Bacteroidales bacterium]